jgi:hypothetical protein
MVFGSMQDWSSWCMVTRVQFVTTPAMRSVPSPLERVMRSSTAVALKSLMLGKERTFESRVEVKSACSTILEWDNVKIK